MIEIIFFFSAFLNIGYFLYKKIFFQKYGEQYNSDELGFTFLSKFNNYLNFVVLPQGVRGYFIDLVRPPCGWSTAFIATPRTIDLTPKLLQ